MSLVDEIIVDFRAGDRLLLCSDGVSRSIDPTLEADDAEGIDQFAERLLSTALRLDGSDNATLVVVQLAPGGHQ